MSSIARFMGGGISTCPTRNSLTFTCGLRLPVCRMLVTTISSQSRQESTMLPKSTLPEIQYFLPPDPNCEKQNFFKKNWEKLLPKIRSFFYISPVEIPLFLILSICPLFINHSTEKIDIAPSSPGQFILEILYIHCFFMAISAKTKYISNSYIVFNHNDPVAQYLKIKFTDFKAWLQEYLTDNNSQLS